jgi:xanthine dehydrogenase accessory factor
MNNLLAALQDGLAGDGRAVLVTVAAGTGSTPRETGASMVVRATDCAGTIGGGHLEFEAIRLARGALAAVPAPLPWIVRFPLAARLGQCCGGVATLAFVPISESAAGWLGAARNCARTAVPFALVTRIGGSGTAASTLVVTQDDANGTLAGAAADTAAIAIARTRLAARTPGAGLYPAPVPDGSTLLVHIVAPDDFPVLVFGNGHVGRALVKVLATLPAQVQWIDGRERDFPAAAPENCEIVIDDAPEALLAEAPRGACVVVLTHSHELDFTLVDAAIAREDWRYLGLIGSRAKRAQFERRLLARGRTPRQWSQVVCPIGATLGLRSKEPGAIAVGVAAELLAAREAAAVPRIPIAAHREPRA